MKVRPVVSCVSWWSKIGLLVQCFGSKEFGPTWLFSIFCATLDLVGLKLLRVNFITLLCVVEVFWQSPLCLWSFSWYVALAISCWTGLFIFLCCHVGNVAFWDKATRGTVLRSGSGVTAVLSVWRWTSALCIIVLHLYSKQSNSIRRVDARLFWFTFVCVKHWSTFSII